MFAMRAVTIIVKVLPPRAPFIRCIDYLTTVCHFRISSLRSDIDKSDQNIVDEIRNNKTND